VSSDLQAVLLLLVLAMALVSGTAVALTRDPRSQAIVLSAYGLVLGLLLLVLHAPDVAMSQLAIGSVAVPLLIVLAITTCDREARARRDEHGHEPESEDDG
jgi:energy-converting hydrogenase B subunit D